MEVLVTVKELGKKRQKLCDTPFTLEHEPNTVSELIKEAVSTCVKEYNARIDNSDEISALSSESIEAQSEVGKIAFGINYNGKKADLHDAVNTAIQGYIDGLFCIFLNEKRLGEINEQIEISQGDKLVFIRLTMLSGRMW